MKKRMKGSFDRAKTSPFSQSLMVVAAGSHEMDSSDEIAKTRVRGERKTRIKYKTSTKMGQYV
jgi:hypothetical protein